MVEEMTMAPEIPSEVPKPRARTGRRDPEKRRLQNREAQRAYRARKKQQVGSLERREATDDREAGAPSDLVPDSEPLAGPSSALTRLPTAIPVSGVDMGVANMDVTAGSELFLDRAPTAATAATPFDEDPLSSVNWSLDPDIVAFMSSPSESNNGESQAVALISTHRTAPRSCQCLTPYCLSKPSLPHLSFSSNLRIEAMCVVAAMQQNCFHLGITGAMFCSSDAESLFFRPGMDASTSQTSLIQSTQRVFKTVKYDLRPSKTQIVKSHHPYIDVIPFPGIRDALIHRAADIDEDDFFGDCLSGLSCWGTSGAAISGSGAPWDMRSWEASPWFLAKWKDVVGGEDGELGRQSMWWREMRGEEWIVEE